MKTSSINIIVIFAFVSCISQVAFSKNNPLKKGGHIIMGSFVVNNQGGDLYEKNGERVTTIQAAPSYSYLISDRLAIGAGIPFQWQKEDKDSRLGYGIAPHIICFFELPSTNIVYPYMELSYAFSRTRYVYDTGYFSEFGLIDRYEEKFIYHSHTIAIGCGIMYMVTQSLGVITEISYANENMNGVSGTFMDREVDNDFSASGNSINVSVGISAVLR